MDNVNEITIEELDLSNRAYVCLKDAWIFNVGEIRRRFKKASEMLAVRNLGKEKTLEIIAKLKELGVDIENDFDEP